MTENLERTHEIVDYHGDFKMRIFSNKEYENYPRHWHTDIEIIMPIENSFKVVIDEITYNLDVGDIIIIPPGELHQLYAPPSGYRIILQFDCTLLYNLNGFNSAFHIFHPCVMVTPSSMPDIYQELSTLIMKINLENFSTVLFREASIYAMLIRFFAILGRNCINKNDKPLKMRKQKQHEYIDVILNVCNYINDYCTEDIKMDDMAKVAGFSKFHFARIFKQVMNISCYEYLINSRIIHAKKLLNEHDLSIMQVAMRSGFSSLATFNRVFKAQSHCTPKEYRFIS